MTDSEAPDDVLDKRWVVCSRGHKQRRTQAVLLILRDGSFELLPDMRDPKGQRDRAALLNSIPGSHPLTAHTVGTTPGVVRRVRCRACGLKFAPTWKAGSHNGWDLEPPARDQTIELVDLIHASQGS